MTSPKFDQPASLQFGAVPRQGQEVELGVIGAPEISSSNDTTGEKSEERFRPWLSRKVADMD